MRLVVVSSVAMPTMTTTSAATTPTATIVNQADARRYHGGTIVPTTSVGAAASARGPASGLAGGEPGRYRLTGTGLAPVTRGPAASGAVWVEAGTAWR